MTTPTQELARSMVDGVIREEAWLRRHDAAHLGPFVLQVMYMAWAPWEGLRAVLPRLSPPHEPILTPEQRAKLGPALERIRAKAEQAARAARRGA